MLTLTMITPETSTFSEYSDYYLENYDENSSITSYENKVNNYCIKDAKLLKQYADEYNEELEDKFYVIVVHMIKKLTENNFHHYHVKFSDHNINPIRRNMVLKRFNKKYPNYEIYYCKEWLIFLWNFDDKKNFLQVSSCDMKIEKVHRPEFILNKIEHAKKIVNNSKKNTTMIHDDIITRITQLALIGQYNYECDLEKYKTFGENKVEENEIYENIKSVYENENYLVKRFDNIVNISWC